MLNPPILFPLTVLRQWFCCCSRGDRPQRLFLVSNGLEMTLFYVSSFLFSNLINSRLEEGANRFAGSLLACPHFVVSLIFRFHLVAETGCFDLRLL